MTAENYFLSRLFKNKKDNNTGNNDQPLRPWMRGSKPVRIIEKPEELKKHPGKKTGK